MRPTDAGIKLIAAARATIHEALGGPRFAFDAEEWMLPPTATFVTLRQGEELRGCVGSIVARQPLIEDVRSNALGSAFRDPRFSPLLAHELPHTRIELAILSAPIEVACASEDEAIANIEKEIDGVIFHMGPLRSVFLPQVWKDLPDPHEFFAHLKRKAGVADDFWSPAVRIERFRTEKFLEEAPPRRELLS
jgi:AmmeMemoRadiSam system protein A